jgi:hypothetical protein
MLLAIVFTLLLAERCHALLAIIARHVDLQAQIFAPARPERS